MNDDEFADAIANVLAQIRGHIDRVGWALQGVFATEKEGPAFIPWAYTIGLWENWRHPEIIIVGRLSMETIGSLLNTAGDKVSKGHRYQPSAGQRYPGIISGHEVPFSPVPNVSTGDWFNMAHLHYGDYNFEAIQMLWPDREGHFPTEDLYSDEVLLTQPLLAMAT